MEDVARSRAVLKPCSNCRARKVKCDRGNPCKECVRFNKSCIYDAPEGQTPSLNSAGTEDGIHERLARLEALLAQQSSSSSSSNGTDAKVSVPTAPNEQPSVGISRAVARAAELHGPSEGTLLTAGDATVFVDRGFWAYLFQASGEMQMLPETEDGFGSCLDVVLGGPLPTINPVLTSEQEALLVNLFFERGEPFIGMLHGPSFRRDCHSFWVGNHPNSKQFGSLINCILVLTAKILPEEAIRTTTGMEKKVVVSSLSHRAHASLFDANVSATANFQVLQALLYWITFLYQDGYTQSASAAMGLANQIARRQGLHRDPSTLGVKPLTAEIRARAWNYLCHLRTRQYELQGVSGNFLEELFYPSSIHDDDWANWTHTQVPQPPASSNVWRKFATLRRQFSALTCHLMQLTSHLTISVSDEILKLVDDQTQEYFETIERGFPVMRKFEAMCVRIWHERLELSLEVAHLKSGRKGGDEFKDRLIARSLRLLGIVERAEAAVAPLGWTWLFEGDPEFLAISVLLCNIINRLEYFSQEQVKDAWRHIEMFHVRHSHANSAGGALPGWKIIDHFTKQARDHIQASQLFGFWKGEALRYHPQNNQDLMESGS